MKISIITVVYNNERTIEQAISSVLSQVNVDLEYIIIDGGSNDRTVEILRQYESNIAFWCSEKDKGLYDAMNKGISKATGDIIGILNSDDLYEDENVLSDVLNMFKTHTDTEIVFGNLVYVKSDDVKKVVRIWKSRKYFAKYFELGNVPPHPALFVRANVYEVAGRFNINYKLAADYEFMLRIFKKFHFKSLCVDRLMVRMRLGGETNKSLKNIINGNKEILTAWKELDMRPPLYLMPLRLIKRISQFV